MEQRSAVDKPNTLAISITEISADTSKRRIGCGTLLLLALLLCSSPWIFRSIVTAFNVVRWSSYGITNYTMTVHHGGLGGFGGPINITVQNGKIAEIDFPSADVAIDEADFLPFQRFTIDKLFSASFNCVIYCSVTYDATYGFPIVIDQGGFLERGDFVEVTDFQPILSE